MKPSRKVTYTASATAIAVVCIILSRYTPLSVMPLMVAALCFFIGLKCGFVYGLITIALSLLLTSFWGSADITLLLTLFLFSPYSVAAFFMRKLKYKNPKQAAVRAGVTLALFNVVLALIIFVFLDIIGDLIFGFSLTSILSRLGGLPMGYIIIAVILSVFAVGYDIMFVMADEVISKRLGLKDKKED